MRANAIAFASYFDGAYGQTASIEVSTDGVNFTEVVSLDPVSEWVTETVDLSEYSGVPNLYIAFHSNDNGVWASGWAVDDVFITFECFWCFEFTHCFLLFSI